MKKEEFWRDIPGYEGWYQASNYGNIRSVGRMVNHRFGKAFKKGTLLNQCDHNGYKYVTLQKNGVRETLSVHRIVAFTFPEICGSYFDGAEANHLNDVRENNMATNINWLSRIDNIRYGNHISNCIKSLTNNPKRSKKINQYTKNNVFIKQWPSQGEIQRVLGYSQGAISACCSGKRKTYKGFKWAFA